MDGERVEQMRHERGQLASMNAASAGSVQSPTDSQMRQAMLMSAHGFEAAAISSELFLELHVGSIATNIGHG